MGKYIQLHSIPPSFTGVKNAMAASMEFRSGTGSASCVLLAMAMDTKTVTQMPT